MATLISYTIEEVLSKISDLRGETTTNTDANRVRAVSDAERAIALRKKFDEHLLTGQTATGTGVNAYTIGTSTYPMRKKGLDVVYVGDTLATSQYAIVERRNFTDTYNQNPGAQLAYEWYDVANNVWKMYISPAVETGVTIYYNYYFLPPVKTMTTDTVLTPNKEIIARLALAYIMEGEEEYDLADTYKNEVEQMLTELLALDNDTPNGVIRVMGSPYGGIGTY